MKGEVQGIVVEERKVGKPFILVDLSKLYIKEKGELELRIVRYYTRNGSFFKELLCLQGSREPFKRSHVKLPLSS